MHVLIVEGYPAAIARLQQLLTAEGHLVEIATSPQQAEATLGGNAIQLVVIDVQQRTSEALALVKRLRQANRSLSIVGYAGTAVPYESLALEAGCDFFIEKPFVHTDVLASIALSVRRHLQAA